MHTLHSAWLSLAMVGLVGAAPALAQAPAKPPVKKPPAAAPAPAAAGVEDAIRQASAAYVAALNAGDFKSAAGFWSPDGEFVDSAGQAIKGRQVVAEELAKRFPPASRPQIQLTVNSVRTITPDSAIEDGSASVTPTGTATATVGRYSAVWVRQQGKWLIHSIRDSGSAARTHNHSLSELDWMIGRWVAQAEGQTVYLDCSWTPGKIYLMREIRIEQDGKLKHSITQRIGLDPLSPRIKSWAFDADGSLAEAFWEKTSAGWEVISRGATRNGRVTSAKNLYSEIGKESFVLESADAKMQNENLASFKVTFNRTNSAADGPAGDNAPGSNAADNGPADNQASAGDQAADEAARQKILQSASWRETQRAFNEWLSVQKIYMPDEIPKIRAELAARIAKMSARQLQDFLEDSHDKLAVLMSKQAEEARLWLAQRMAVEVKMTPEQIKEMRPDVVNMTAAQIQQRLAKLQEERQQNQQLQAAFDTGRKDRIKAIQQSEKVAEKEREEGIDRAYESMSAGGGYGGYYGGGAVNNAGVTGRDYRGGFSGWTGWGGWGGFRY